ncbi:MAG: TonB family protein [Balneolaceae bacterium]
MKALILIFIASIAFNKVSVAQVDSVDCESKYLQWEELLEENNGSMDFMDKSPELVGGMEALYDSLDYPQGSFEGQVIVKFLVNENGSTLCFEMIRGFQNVMDQAAIDAIKKVEFKPAIMDGKPLTIPYVIPVNFSIKE